MPDTLIDFGFKKKPFYLNKVSRIKQVTLSKFIDLGYYESHINYMCDIYKEKTRVVKETVLNLPLAGKTEIWGDTAGMYLNMSFNVSLSEETAKEICIKNGIK